MWNLISVTSFDFVFLVLSNIRKIVEKKCYCVSLCFSCNTQKAADSKDTITSLHSTLCITHLVFLCVFWHIFRAKKNQASFLSKHYKCKYMLQHNSSK